MITTAQSDPPHPEAAYWVVALTSADPRAHDDWLHHQGARLLQESMQVRRAMWWLPLRSDPVEVLRVFSPASTPEGRQYNRRMAEEMGLTPYLRWGAVYYVSPGALRMFSDAGIELEVIGTLGELDPVLAWGSTLRGMYYTVPA